MLLRVIEPYWANREKLYKYSFLSYRVLLLLIIFCVKLIKEYHVMRAQLPRTQGFFPSRGRRSATSTHDASTVEAKCPCMGSMGPRCQLSKYLTFSFPYYFSYLQESCRFKILVFGIFYAALCTSYKILH